MVRFDRDSVFIEILVRRSNRYSGCIDELERFRGDYIMSVLVQKRRDHALAGVTSSSSFPAVQITGVF